MIQKDLIKLLIAEYQREISNIQLVNRAYEMEDGLNYIFVGLRRAGKSYLMFQQIQRLLKNGHSINEILYFNFEDDRLTMMDAADLDVVNVVKYQKYLYFCGLFKYILV